MRLCKRSERYLNDTKLHENGKDHKQLQWNLFCSVTRFGVHCSFTAKLKEWWPLWGGSAVHRFCTHSVWMILSLKRILLSIFYVMRVNGFVHVYSNNITREFMVCLHLRFLGRMRPCMADCDLLVLKNRNSYKKGFYSYLSSRFLFTHGKNRNRPRNRNSSSNGRCKRTFSPSFRYVWLVIHICYKREKLVKLARTVARENEIRPPFGRRENKTENFGFIFKEYLISHWAIPNLKWWILTTKNE